MTIKTEIEKLDKKRSKILHAAIFVILLIMFITFFFVALYFEKQLSNKADRICEDVNYTKDVNCVNITEYYIFSDERPDYAHISDKLSCDKVVETIKECRIE